MRCAAVAVLLLGAAIALAAPRDPGEAGSLPVGVSTLTATDAARARTLVTDVYYPARSVGRDARVRGGHFPLVLVVHGHCGSRTNYEYLANHLVSRGWIVVTPDIPVFCAGNPGVNVDEPPHDLAFLAGALRDRGGPFAAVARHVRGETTALVGHSLGGNAVLQAAAHDAQFPTVVGLAPFAREVDGMALRGLDPARAVMAIGGTADTTVPLSFIMPFFAQLTPPAYLVQIAGGTHSGFTDMDSHLTADALAAQQAVAKRYVTAFLDRYLRGRRRAAHWLVSSDDGSVTVTAKTE